ncbi:alpha-galactosidase [Microbacterium halimionae]|uniref:alpha-galactosidase n=1 Tax=Microbacterium halimionae TaxID=1526413 RepID=A0A7W3PMC5_9MICO|nr:alpha-galactosidase [Microbacterium halimionae]MBA8817470.1 alpha-galactosidase [Microbacterium halimionae]NII95087.1 alpha-galactosidase [Microbacterium halimionae]
MIHHLRAAGVSLVVDSRGTEVPAIVHWGRDLGALAKNDLQNLVDATVALNPPSSIDRPPRLSLIAGLGEGWSGHPVVALAGVFGTARHRETLSRQNIITSVSEWAAASVTTRLELTADGLLLASHVVHNEGSSAITLTSAAVALPIPDRARELLDFTGLWSRERQPQRQQPGLGVWLRESRHGRGGHDDAFLMVAGTPGFGFSSGEVWATHVAWSGDTQQWFERSPLGTTVLGAGERRPPVTLAPGDTLETPTIVAAWSDQGLDGISSRVHPWVRSWSTHASPRPVTLNTWEAVYFDHSIDRLAPLVDRAADVGVERFVLDDGWFAGRSDDKRALGDWTVDTTTWPDGLWPLIERVEARGMQFGLWVEPEMISPDSELARAHPDWVMSGQDAVTWRWQHVLDLSVPGAEAHVRDSLDALLGEYPIRYLKWDHNRDLLVEDSHEQVSALYRVLDDLRRRHPEVEIESCASGGARIDLGILPRVDRVWTSDTNDPLERQRIQRYTGILIPPEYLGSHLGDARAHTSGRTSSLAFRLATAFFGHAGIESDLTRLRDDDLQVVRRWIAAHREHRELLHSGTVVHVDEADPAAIVHGVIALDGSEAVFSYALVSPPETAVPPRLRMPRLDPEQRYRVERLDVGAEPHELADAPPPWLTAGVETTGRALDEVGLAMPGLLPGEAQLFAVRAI